MTHRNTQTDVAEAQPQHWPLVDTDIEINANVQGDDLIVRVNKNGILVCRVLLEDAATAMDAETLMRFSTFAPAGTGSAAWRVERNARRRTGASNRMG